MAKIAKPKKPKVFNKKTFIIQLLRRGTYRYPVRTQAIKAAWRSRGKYECAHCTKLVGPKDYKVDHVHPVVDPKDGYIDWNTYIDRMYPDDVNAFQVLCEQCHDSKTAVESEMRKHYKAVKKSTV